MDNYFNAAACSSSNQSLTPVSSLLQYPYQNFSMIPANQQLTDFNYYNAQSGDISRHNQIATKPAAVAVVRAVIAINEGDEMPHLVNQESAVFGYNNAHKEVTTQYNEQATASVAAAVDRSMVAMQSAISNNHDNRTSYFTNQCSNDLNYNYQNNYGFNEAIAQYSEEEIMSTGAPTLQPITTVEPTIPTNPDDFPGELNFQFFINSDETYKTSFVYSKQLGKVFLSMKKVLPVQFSWENYSSNLRVRACMMFQDGHSRDKPVQRCNAHKASDLEENKRIEPVQLRFTFRTNQYSSLYQEDANNGFLSIVTPAGLPNPGRDYFQVDYQFFCMTSCVTGINRRATFLVFTLENDNEFVFGRRSLPIQICCCPKRDMEKEEKNTVNPTGKKKWNKNKKIEKPAPYPVPRPQCISSLPQPTINLPKSVSTLPDNGEDELLDLSLKIVGGDNYLGVLNFAYSKILKDAYENNAFDKYREVLDDIRQKIKEYEGATSSTQ